MGWDCKPAAVMVAVSVAFAVMNILSKKVIDEGMSHLVLITLRQLLATLFMAPIAFISERKSGLKLTAVILLHIFVSALLGVSLLQFFFFLGLQYTSATFSCAFLNMVPAMTFLIALPFRSLPFFKKKKTSFCYKSWNDEYSYVLESFRMERVDLGSRAGVMKALGAVMCVAGAVVLAAYRGVSLTGGKGHVEGLTVSIHARKWVAGSAALLVACSSWSSWFLVQSKMAKLCPAVYTTTAIMFFLSFLQVAVVSLMTHGNRLQWVPRSRVEVATVIFSGLVGSGICLLATTWSIKQNGPVFTAAFSPLTQIIVAGIGITVLGESLHMGSVLGSILVVSGLYSLLWGKSKESNAMEVNPVQGGPVSKGPVETV